MAAKVFISYRRRDSKYQARMIYNAFCAVLPRDSVFMDVDSIPPGSDFVEILEGWVEKCEVLVALIGPGWASRKRLQNEHDFVRIEIRKALKRRIPVVPVLLDGTPMPKPEHLPDDLKKFVRRQAEIVDFRTFDTDVERLIKKLGMKAQVAKQQNAQDAPIQRRRKYQHIVKEGAEQLQTEVLSSRLSPHQLERLIECLVKHFNMEELDEQVRLSLGRDLWDYAGVKPGSSFQIVVFRLLTATERSGSTLMFFRSAIRRRPAMKDLVVRILPKVAEPEPEIANHIGRVVTGLQTLRESKE